MNATMNASTGCKATSAQLIDEIRRRLQAVHFAVRGLPCQCPCVDEPLADQVHAIRMLAEELGSRG
jgi:hypothetical protein